MKFLKNYLYDLIWYIILFFIKHIANVWRFLWCLLYNLSIFISWSKPKLSFCKLFSMFSHKHDISIKCSCQTTITGLWFKLNFSNCNSKLKKFANLAKARNFHAVVLFIYFLRYLFKAMLNTHQNLIGGQKPATILNVTLLLSVCEAGGSEEWGVKEMPSPFPRSPVIREWLWKKTQIE